MAPRVCDRRVVALVACLYAALSTGTSYAFGVYSGALGATFNLTIDQLDTITMVGSFSGALTFLGGLVSDRCGPHVAVLVGGLLMSSSFALFWAFGTLVIDAHGWFADDPSMGPLVMFCALTFVQYFSSGCITGGVFSVVVRNFPGQKGSAVGLVKAFVGICGGMFTQFYVGVFGVPDDNPDTLRFQLIIAGCVVAIAVAPSPLVRAVKAPPPVNKETVGHHRSMFRFLFGALFLFIATITAASLVENALEASSADDFGTVMGALTGVILFELLLPLFGAVYYFCVCGGGSSSSCSSSNSDSLVAKTAATSTGQLDGGVVKDDQRSTPLLRDVVAGEGEGGGLEGGGVTGGDDASAVVDPLQAALASRPPLRGELTLRQMLCTWEAPLLLFVAVTLAGAGYLFTTNVNAMCAAGQMSEAAPSIAVTLFSTAQALGRVVFGVVPDFLLGRQAIADHRRRRRAAAAAEGGGDAEGAAVSASCCCEGRLRLTRSTFFALIVLLMMAGNALQLVGGETALYIATAINGLAFGGLWPLLVVSAAEIWGNTHLGANYMFFDGFAALLGGTAFGKLLPQAFFDKFSTDGGLTCVGQDCFLWTHLVTVGILAVALGCSAVLIQRTKLA